MTNAIRLLIIKMIVGNGTDAYGNLNETISSIKWTDESIEHVARHAVRPEEVEEVCFNEEEIPFIRSGRENLHYVFGKTNLEDFFLL